MAKIMNVFLFLGSILMFIGVGMGAFGAHSLAEFLAETGREGTFETAVRYQIYHGLGLLLIGFLNSSAPAALLTWSGWCLFAGASPFVLPR